MYDNNDLTVRTPAEEMPESPIAATKKYRPTNQEALREFDIRIKFLNRGCIVSVGCKEIAFEDYTNAMKAINDYVTNPWEEQEKWRKILN